ncbi:3-phosphoshikimate 1-carboxyvinyltransferase [Glaciecola petra]|uniref:3-phosphoshikimate 1-carboxyvinyltransferase n=1 Tax=Glaciecola petra TaxID=3075602 RepID=A0ABU2ZNT8_9ALTE|nr:3-phosphoshikimate 1-carboxyvinyltransferase [Aestuariibacter sp. P117]MDT0594285.1 3-phosphoshikimate 1-carboxyvinyltransferase [Aestuariibacter sp. P117]
MQQLTLSPIKKVSGTINVPGSKSLSNRALLLAALSKGKSKLVNLLDSEDIQHMLTALRQLGVNYSLNTTKTECVIEGIGGKFKTTEKLSLFLGNAGTAMRPLCAALAFSDVDVVLTGEPRMEERPIGDLADELINAGANISYLKNEGYPPLEIKKALVKRDHFVIDGSVSSQFLTALLMAAPLLQKTITIDIKGTLVSSPYIDITIATMAKFGVRVENNAYQQFIVKGQQEYIASEHFLVEGDASSASYFLAAAAIKGGDVKVTGVGTNSIQGDIRFADVLEEMGATVTWYPDSIEVSNNRLLAVDMDMNHIPDAAMTIATTALFATGTTCIRNIYNWRVKETDRLHAMATELRKVGALVDEGHDYICITPPNKIQHATIDTYNDHRMAMCFALVALDDHSGVTINDPACTAKTFPSFFEAFGSICEK